MVYILYGLIGAMLTLGLFGGGALVAWLVLRRRYGVSSTRQTREDPGLIVSRPDAPMSAEETEQVRRYRQEIEAEQAAFRKMLGYNINTALGLESDLRADDGKE